MFDVTKLTPEQASKIECALLMLTANIKDNISAYEKLAKSDFLDEKTRATSKSNAEWWAEVLAIIDAE